MTNVCFNTHSLLYLADGMKIIGENPMLDSIDMGDYRLMLYYKGDISALTLFLQQENGSICFPKKLPLLSTPIDPIDFHPSKVSLFPVVLVNAITKQLQLPTDLLKADAGFNEQIETPKGVTTVYMARFMLLDPPRINWYKVWAVRLKPCLSYAVDHLLKWSYCAALIFM
jgi:hypothetical protein